MVLVVRSALDEPETVVYGGQDLAFAEVLEGAGLELCYCGWWGCGWGCCDCVAQFAFCGWTIEGVDGCGVCVFELEAAGFEGGDYDGFAAEGDEDIIGEVGCDEED